MDRRYQAAHSAVNHWQVKSCVRALIATSHSAGVPQFAFVARERGKTALLYGPRYLAEHHAPEYTAPKKPVVTS